METELKLKCPNCGKISAIYAKKQNVVYLSAGVTVDENGLCRIDRKSIYSPGKWTFCCQNCCEEITTDIMELENMALKERLGIEK